MNKGSQARGRRSLQASLPVHVCAGCAPFPCREGYAARVKHSLPRRLSGCLLFPAAARKRPEKRRCRVGKAKRAHVFLAVQHVGTPLRGFATLPGAKEKGAQAAPLFRTYE